MLAPVPPPAGRSGSAGQPGGSCAAISQQATNQRRPADIVMAVDNSGSMDEEIVFVRERLNAFSQQIVDSGVDVRIILISAAMRGEPGQNLGSDDENGICIAAPLGSGACPADSQPPRYTHIAREVGSEDALNLFIETFPEWQGQLRPNATKTFVVVTDDDAGDGPNDSADAFAMSVAGLPGGLFPEWTFSGIYCFDECEDAAAIGQVYIDLVARTQGVGGDLCLQDFTPVFDALAKAVVEGSGLDCAWPIPTPPPGQTFDRDKVNVRYTTPGAPAADLLQVSNAGACASHTAWYYDDPTQPTRILACPQSCTALQGDLDARIDVLFGCATQVLPE
jgi:hypothetical protein